MRGFQCRSCFVGLLLVAAMLVPTGAASAKDRSGLVVNPDRLVQVDSTTFDQAGAIALFFDGTVYFANDAAIGATPGGGIYRILSGGAIELVVSADRPSGLSFDQFNGDLYFTEGANGGVYRSSIVDSDNLTFGPPVGIADLLPGTDMTTGIVILPLGYIGAYSFSERGLVSDPGLDTIIRLDTTTFPDPASITPLQTTNDTEWVSLTANKGHIYVADASATTGGVFEIGANDAGNYLTQVDDGTTLMEPVGVAVGECGRTVYVTTQGQDALYALDPISGAAELLASGFTDLEPNSVAVNLDSDTVWVSDRGTSTIYKFDVVPPSNVIRYTFTNMTFADGGTASGWFDFDPMLASMGTCITGWSDNYEISVSGGDTKTFAPYTYTDEQDGPMNSGGGTDTLDLLNFGQFLVQVGNRFIDIGVNVHEQTLGRDLTIPLASSPGNTIEYIVVSTSPFHGEFRQIQPGGSLVGTVIEACPADLTDDGAVDVFDLLQMLQGWGTPGADVTGDGTTDVFDLLALLQAWGPCA